MSSGTIMVAEALEATMMVRSHHEGSKPTISLPIPHSGNLLLFLIYYLCLNTYGFIVNLNEEVSDKAGIQIH